MGKQKFESQDEAKAALVPAKEAVETAKVAVEKFLEENKLKRKTDYSDDPKFGKQYKKLNAALTAARENRDSIKEAIKELKPKSERGYQYDYPADIKGDAAKMKKFRAAERAKKRKAEKEAAAPPPAAKASKEKGEGKPKKKAKAEAED